jgi:hypothetical protein
MVEINIQVFPVNPVVLHVDICPLCGAGGLAVNRCPGLATLPPDLWFPGVMSHRSQTHEICSDERMIQPIAE